MKVNEVILDGRRVGEPHPDWEKNKSYLEDVLFNPKVMVLLFDNKTQYVWRGLNKIGQDREGKSLYDLYTHLEFSWTKHDKIYVDPVSLHVPHEKLRDELNKRFRGVL